MRSVIRSPGMLAMSSLGTCATEVAYSGRKTAIRVIGPPALAPSAITVHRQRLAGYSGSTIAPRQRNGTITSAIPDECSALAWGRLPLRGGFRLQPTDQEW